MSYHFKRSTKTVWRLKINIFVRNGFGAKGPSRDADRLICSHVFFFLINQAKKYTEQLYYLQSVWLSRVLIAKFPRLVISCHKNYIDREPPWFLKLLTFLHMQNWLEAGETEKHEMVHNFSTSRCERKGTSRLSVRRFLSFRSFLIEFPENCCTIW